MSKISSRKDSLSSLAKAAAVRSLSLSEREEHSNNSNNDTELFNFLRQMHLTGGANGITVTSVSSQVPSTSEIEPISSSGEGVGVSLLVSRKRKAWEGIHAGGNKWVGGQRPPALRSAEQEQHLHTPQCSNQGFDGGEEGGSPEEGGGTGEGEKDEPGGEKDSHTLLSPLHSAHLLNIEHDIDADNLAADFDGSFTGLGVDINTANYSMSEAMLSLNSLAVAGPGQAHIHSRHESAEHTGIPSRFLTLKSEQSSPQYLFSSYGALDLSNDEAQHPEEHQEVSPLNSQGHPPSFSGSVSRENSQDSGAGAARRETILRSTKSERERAVTESPVKERETEERVEKYQFLTPHSHSQPPQQQSVILAAAAAQATAAAAQAKAEHSIHSLQSVPSSDDESDSRFQYILAAPTSICTKPGEPSLTYINQGQSYEIKIKKLGDISSHYRKKWLRSTIRICFHERRLQYIETEQIAEWSKTRPNERILEVDLPLSYGIADVKQETTQLNAISFLWDPTRDTGIFVKVHCISTEFTPKKHGGERGVPFRLQMETWSSSPDVRLHAAACILQVFKLKGADRKHKQDKERMLKRPEAEKDKFSPQYECTMLQDLSVDSIYMPPSRGISPVHSDSETQLNTSKSSLVSVGSRDESPLKLCSVNSLNLSSQGTQPAQQDNKSWKTVLDLTANHESVAGWLGYNRYGQHVKTFTDFDARDLLRLSKDDIVQMIGLVDGVRLYNDLHMKPVAPRLVFFVAQKEERLFHPILLQELTVDELRSKMAEFLEVPVGIFHKIIFTSPNNIDILMTDEYLRIQPSEMSLHYSLVHGQGEGCNIRLEKA